jgi:hypothetical protein
LHRHKNLAGQRQKSVNRIASTGRIQAVGCSRLPYKPQASGNLVTVFVEFFYPYVCVEMTITVEVIKAVKVIKVTTANAMHPTVP